jgi:hypothetical protein
MHPTTVNADVMKPLPVDGPAAPNYVLHCLRGPDANKAIAIRNVADVLTPRRVLFRRSITRRRLGRSCGPSTRGADVDNLGDTAGGLRRILEESFQTAEVDVIGSIAHFTATGPRQAGSRSGP